MPLKLLTLIHLVGVFFIFRSHFDSALIPLSLIRVVRIIQSPHCFNRICRIHAEVDDLNAKLFALAFRLKEKNHVICSFRKNSCIKYVPRNRTRS